MMGGENCSCNQPVRFVQIYSEASQGMKPVSWGSLGLIIGADNVETAFYADDIEELAADQLQDDYKYDESVKLCKEIRQQLEISERPPGALTDDEIWKMLDDIITIQREYEKAMWSRRERARHYGMLICRAFFQHINIETQQGFWKRLPFDVLDIIEQFVNF